MTQALVKQILNAATDKQVDAAQKAADKYLALKDGILPDPVYLALEILNIRRQALKAK